MVSFYVQGVIIWRNIDLIQKEADHFSWHLKMWNPFRKSEIVIDKWIGRVKNYVIMAELDLIEDKSMVFTVEAQMFFTYTEPTRNLSVIVRVIFRLIETFLWS